MGSQVSGKTVGKGRIVRLVAGYGKESWWNCKQLIGRKLLKLKEEGRKPF